MSELLEARKIGKVFAKGPERIEVLKDLDLSVPASRAIAIIGASGVGKTTLLHLLGALDHPTQGEVFYHGESLSKKGGRVLARFRNESIGFIFQFHYLLPEFNAAENVAVPLWMKGESKAKALESARSLLDFVGLKHRVTHRPTELSGGEQQRVAIARALIGNPSLVLADEPTGDLDIETGRSIMDLLFSVARERGRSMIVATHNMELAARADQVFRLKEGRLFEETLLR